MTDRHAGYVVTLTSDIREDDAESTLNALRHIKGVVAVEPIIAEGAMYSYQMVIEGRVRANLAENFRAFLDNLDKK